MHYMLGDFFTKPLQGTLFIQMREKILNLPSSIHMAMSMSVLEKVKSSENVNMDGKTNNE